MKLYLSILGILILSIIFNGCTSKAQETKPRAYKAPTFTQGWGQPGAHPDHIVLNFPGDPATMASVTWRTNTDITEGYAEIAIATAAPKFWRNAKTIKAETEEMDASDIPGAEVVSHYHSVVFSGLTPDTMYAYRVGDGERWSEWIQFKTASNEAKPFSFLYVGDAQNYILELWSRLIREGYRRAPDANFIIHAGDLINSGHNEREWHEWFMAGGWIHRMLPSIPLPGNHEYRPITEEDRENGVRRLSVQWRPQFTLPENGPEGLEESVYYVDYQGTRLIALNTNEKQDVQTEWLKGVLEENPNTWTIVSFHHPLFSASEGRDNKPLREMWKPIFDEYKVDLVLQGHDHSYARGRVAAVGENVVDGVNKRDYTGTVYVVSVSGGKMYELKKNAWEDYEAERDRGAENTQLIQLIEVDGNILSFKAYTATGELYDAFTLEKQGEGKPNKFIEQKGDAIPERRHDNTIPYQDYLPKDIESDLMAMYPDYELDGVRYVDDTDFNGYYVNFEYGDKEIDLKVSLSGEIMEEQRSED